jgi:hypothetical protein
MYNALVCAIELLVLVESGGNWNVVGDGGAALGGMQIHREAVDDVNRILGTKTYRYADRTNPVKSREMARIYLGHYCTKRRLGREPTIEDYVRCWNGGPSYRSATGQKLANLNNHWRKACQYMGDERLLAVVAKRLQARGSRA